MPYFNIDPKPVNFIHPNGIRRIKNISFGAREELIPIIRELCDDPVLTLFTGRGIKDLDMQLGKYNLGRHFLAAFLFQNKMPGRWSDPVVPGGFYNKIIYYVHVRLL